MKRSYFSHLKNRQEEWYIRLSMCFNSSEKRQLKQGLSWALLNKENQTAVIFEGGTFATNTTRRQDIAGIGVSKQQHLLSRGRYNRFK